MPVKLSRFVRVMTGGKLVTDELVEVRDAKVGNAVAELQAQIERLGDAGLSTPALAGAYSNLVKARADANAKASNAEKCAALEQAKFDARDAVADAKQQVDAGLVTATEKATKLGEVDTALGALRTTVAGIGGAGFKNPAAAPLAGLSARRDALANAADVTSAKAEIANAAALLVDIGTAKTAADRAAKAEKDQAAQLALVNTALGSLTTKEAAIALQVLKAPLTLRIPPLTGRRDTLAGVADTATAEAQVALAPALIADINSAVSDAQVAANNATALIRRRDRVDSYINAGGNWIASLEDGTPKTALEGGHNTLKADRTAFDTAAATALSGAMTALESASRTLYDDARTEAAAQKKANADLWVAAFKGWEAKIGKISSSNPVKTETAALRLEKQAADNQADAGRRREALETFIDKADALQTKVQDMQARKAEIEKTGMTITALLTLKPPPSTPPTALANERATVLAAIPGAFNQPTTDAVMTRLGTLKTDMLAVKPKAEDWRAGQLDLTKLKASVTKSLTEAGAAIAKLAAGTEKSELEAALAGLNLRKTGADSMVEAEAKKSLFAIDKEALGLLERTHKQGFSEQLAAPDGKQKIDVLIKSLGDKAADPQTEAVCRAALAARFKLEVEVLEGLSVDRLPRLYNLFAQVPESHVGHDKLTKLQYNTDPAADASYYSKGSTKIVLVMGETDSTYPYKAQTGSAVENLNYFSATALHEIGHGVDEKQQIMTDSRMAGADFGGWKKESIDSVAQAHYTKSFASLVTPSGPTQADLMAMIKTVLEAGTCTQPTNATATLGPLFAKWADITASQGYKDLAKVRGPAASPWNKPIAAGDRAYHEAYDGTWVSYLTAERPKGISNYQWRAPAEWFAELYAYYHMTKKDVPSCVESYIKG